jgi:hypothetical protein
MEIFPPLPDKLAPACDTSDTASVIGELCLKHPVNVLPVFLKEKSNDHSLPVLYPAVKS